VAQERGRGNPTYIATIDRNEGRIVAKHLLAMASPAVPDRHATPVIAADSQGFLHVICGSHNEPFLYLRSRKPNSITDGWTTPRKVGGKQTYATLVCDPQDHLHTIYRVHPKLLYRHKPASADEWSAPATLAHPPDLHTGYTIYYHRLFIDRRGALYASFTFMETHTGSQGRYPRYLAMSEDHGATWQLATTDKFKPTAIHPRHTQASIIILLVILNPSLTSQTYCRISNRRNRRTEEISKGFSHLLQHSFCSPVPSVHHSSVTSHTPHHTSHITHRPPNISLCKNTLQLDSSPPFGDTPAFSCWGIGLFVGRLSA